jgi:HlyD family secretion protein
MPRMIVFATAAGLLIVLALWLVARLTRTSVTVSPAVEAPVVQAFYSTGTIQPVREFPIKANVAGTLTEVLVDKGDRVKSGQPLAIVNEPSLQYAYDRAIAELKEKQARADASSSPVLQEFTRRIEAMNAMLEIAHREQDRQQRALESRAGSQSDLDRALDRVKVLHMDIAALEAQRQAKLLELQREVDVAQAAVNTARWTLDQQTLRSPVDGVVLDRPTSQGTRVAINDVVTRVADVRPEKLLIRAAVDEEDVVNVRVDQPVRITLYAFANQVFSGKVDRIYDQADADRRTFEVDVVFERPHERFSPGMTGELAFITGEKDKAVVVPSQAVAGGVVWTVHNGTLRRNDVRVGLRSVERSEIVSGISAGDLVVLTPPTDLEVGQHVRVTELDPATAAGLNKSPEAEAGNFRGFN